MCFVVVIFFLLPSSLLLLLLSRPFSNNKIPSNFGARPHENMLQLLQHKHKMRTKRRRRRRRMELSKIGMEAHFPQTALIVKASKDQQPAITSIRNQWTWEHLQDNYKSRSKTNQQTTRDDEKNAKTSFYLKTLLSSVRTLIFPLFACSFNLPSV